MCIRDRNNSEDVNGILVQLPLPKTINEEVVLNSIAPEKDADGFHPLNVGKLSISQKNDESLMIPCTPYGCLLLLRELNINLAGKLEKQGITLMFNAPRDHNYHLIRQGAGNAVANGMSYIGAIMALTSNVAESFNIPERGRLQQGMKADLVIWEGDPLEPSTFPSKVFINGNDMDLTTRSS